MKRFSPTEKGALLLAVVLFAVGGYMVVCPFETELFHFGTDNTGGGGRSYFEHVSRREMQIYGVISMVFGGGITAYVLYRPRE
jgi:hypothetical protein